MGQVGEMWMMVVRFRVLEVVGCGSGFLAEGLRFRANGCGFTALGIERASGAGLSGLEFMVERAFPERGGGWGGRCRVWWEWC